MAGHYTRDQLIDRLNKAGWRMSGGDHGEPAEGTLREVAEAAHAHRAKGRTPGRLEEIETRIEVGLIQLEELWHHLGLPV